MNDVVKYALAAVGGRGSALALSLCLSYVLSEGVFAQYSYLASLVTILLLFGQLGLPVLVSREVARFEVDPPLRKGITVFALAANLVGLVLAGAVLFYIAPEAPAAPHQLWLTFGMVALYSFAMVLTNVLTGLGRVYEAYWPDALLRYPVTLILVVAVLALAPGRLDLDAVLACLLVGHFATFAILATKTLRQLPSFWTRAPAAFRTRAWVVSVLVLSGASLATLLNSRVDVLMLEALSSLSQLADYAFVLQFVLFFMFPTIIANAFLLPRFSAAHGRDDAGAANADYVFASTLMLSATILVAAGLVLLALTLWPMLAPEAYRDSGGLIVIFALGYAANAVFGPAGIFVIAFGQERYQLMTALASGVLNIVLNLAMIPTWGAVGAALATVVSMSAANAALFIRATRLRRSARIFDVAAIPVAWRLAAAGTLLAVATDRAGDDDAGKPS